MDPNKNDDLTNKIGELNISAKPLWFFENLPNKKWLSFLDLSEELEKCFQNLRNGNLTPVVTIKGKTFDFINQVFWENSSPQIKICFKRQLSEHSPYKIPFDVNKNVNIGNPNHTGVRWLWWGSNHEYLQHYDPEQPPTHKWINYSLKDSEQIEKKYQEYLDDEGDSNFELDNLYSIDFESIRQFKTANNTKTRTITRVTFQWYWLSDEIENGKNVFKPYSPEITCQIENAYIERRPQVSVNIEGKQYDINLVEMCQFRSLSRFHRRNIKREGFPLNNEDKILINDERCIIRDTYPPYWKLNLSEDANPDDIFTDLPRDSSLFKQIEKDMNSTIVTHGSGYGYIPGTKIEPGYYEIEKIICVQNPDVWENYIVKKTEIRQKLKKLDVNNSSGLKRLKDFPPLVALLDSSVNEYYMFHGTKTKCLELIARLGLDDRLSKVKGMFGHGLYFADRSSKSNQYVNCPTCEGGCFGTNVPCNCTSDQVTKSYGMIISRVILGNPYVCKNWNNDSSYFTIDITQGTPLNEIKKQTNQDYDSVLAESKDTGVSESTLKFREYIVYDRSQCYPEFIVYYKRKKSKTG